MKKIFYLATSLILFSCSETEVEEIEVPVETIVEVPTAVELELISLSATKTMTSESDEETIIITASLDNALDTDSVINLSFNGSAEINSDYTLSATSINIPSGSTAGQIEISVISDNIFESGVENIIVSLAGLSNTITPSQNSTIEIDVTDGSAIVAFSQSQITTEENGFLDIELVLSKPLNEDIVINLGQVTNNNSYMLSSDFPTIIVAGETLATVRVDVNDFIITSPGNNVLNVFIASVNNDDIDVGTNNQTIITTSEDEVGLQINSSWATNNDLFELRIVDTENNEVLSSTNAGNTEALFVDSEGFNSLDNGSYNIELELFRFNNTSPSEVVTFNFFDENFNTFGGPYTFTVNSPANTNIPIFNLEVLDGNFTITQISISN